jgi:hypothetical protein
MTAFPGAGFNTAGRRAFLQAAFFMPAGGLFCAATLFLCRPAGFFAGRFVYRISTATA